MNTVISSILEDEPEGFEGHFEAFKAAMLEKYPESTEAEQEFWKGIYYRGAAAILELLDSLRPGTNPASMVHSVAQVAAIQAEVFDFLEDAEEIDADTQLTTHVAGDGDGKADS